LAKINVEGGFIMSKKSNSSRDTITPLDIPATDNIGTEVANLDLNHDPHLEKHLTKQMQKSIKGVMKM